MQASAQKRPFQRSTSRASTSTPRGRSRTLSRVKPAALRDGDAPTISIFHRNRQLTVCRAHAQYKERCFACGNPNRCEWLRFFSDQVSNNLKCYTITSPRCDRVAVVCNYTRRLTLVLVFLY
ncbi:hypothetical protein Ciccas_008985 [Cichlidogyrus casuarinus]|uniref:Uncharacterized protein n=1 Tax=Cichlidogyrus casuarinus TaxID=1844966 RepID=A0ABD2PZA2_9PLAT